MNELIEKINISNRIIFKRLIKNDLIYEIYDILTLIS